MKISRAATAGDDIFGIDSPPRAFYTGVFRMGPARPEGRVGRPWIERPAHLCRPTRGRTFRRTTDVSERRAMKTAFLTSEQVDRKWWIVDAEGQVLGRMATKIARILQGKHRPSFTPNQDTGEFIIVINAEKVRVTGSKSRNKEYDWYTYHPNGRRVMTYDRMIERHPTRPIELAVRRMMPKSRMGRQMFAKMKVYAGATHPHQAQMPEPLKL